MKLLYKSLIDRDQRHGLGEYYTPDWLAAKMVNKAVTTPLNSSSSIRRAAQEPSSFMLCAASSMAEDAGLEPQDRAAEATRLVAGMDIHPVAVIIARVTYFLALAPAIAARAG